MAKYIFLFAPVLISQLT